MPAPTTPNLEQYLTDLHLIAHRNEDPNDGFSPIYGLDVNVIISRLQTAGLIPCEQPDLDHAMELIDTCVILGGFLDKNLGDSVLLTTIQHAREKGWDTLYQAYARGSSNKAWDIKDAIQDTMKAVFCPQFFRAVGELGVDHPLHQSCQYNPPEDPYLAQYYANRWFTDSSPSLQYASILCKEKDIAELAAFSAHWHAPLQQTVFHKYKTASNASWPSLFQSKELDIPESVIGKKGCKFIARTSPQELTAEGTAMNHCVGGYASKCQREHTHIISCVDEQNQPMSTMELEVVTEAETGQHSIRSIQHRAAGNEEPSTEARKAHEWLLESLNNSAIPVDFNYLEDKRSERVRVDGDPKQKFERSVHTFIEFNPFDVQGLKNMSKVKKLYLKHTLSDFTDNLKELMRLQTLMVDLGSEDQARTIELDLLTKEDRAKVDYKKTQASRWNPSRWTAPKAGNEGETHERKFGY